MYDKENAIKPVNPEMGDIIELLSNDIAWLNAHINKMYRRTDPAMIIAVKRDIRAFLLGVVEHLEEIN